MGNWKKTRIGEFLFEREGKYKPDSTVIEGLKRINKIDFSGKFHIAQKPSNTNMIMVCPGDFVISGINVAKGAMGIYRGNENVTATIHYSSYTFDQTKIDVDYFKRFLKSALFIKLLQEQVKGGIKTEIKPKHILPLEIDLPDINEQRKIVDHFKSIETEDEELKAELTHQQTLLKKLRQQILQEAIEGKLTADWRVDNPDVEPASELLGRIQAEKAQLIKDKKIKKGKKQPPSDSFTSTIHYPDSWELPDLDDISIYITDGTHQTPTYTSSGRIFLSAQNVKPFKFMPEGHKYVSEEAYQEYVKNRIVEKGDLVLGRVGAGIGETAVVDVEIECAIYVSLGLVKTFKEHTDSNYLAIVFNSPYGVSYAKGNISSGGGSAGNFNLGRIRSFPLPLPSLPEQKAIVANVEKLLALCDQLENQITSNQTHSNALMLAVLIEAFTANKGQTNNQTKQVAAHAE